ncbi:MAG: YraN family protein [Candidatus Eremiobacteraeota bacterium]|nr:YraN family protein [Candidatus Eremiobacteraeota bacterium]
MSANAGRAGEAAAVRYLESLGFEILKRNLRGPGAEIDIVARDGRTLVFVEVKARSNRRFGDALAAVDVRKRAKIRALAADFLQFLPPPAHVRFDVVTLEGGQPRLHRGAFA